MREGKEKIEPHHFSKAIDKVMLGEQTDRETTMEEKERVAVHELGHAIVAECVEPGSVAQVVLAPRGQALGYVRHFPGEDRFLYTKRELENRIKICLAGAAAEQLILGNRSTGAQNDYDQAIRLVRTMVETGLSDLGIIDPEWVNKEKVHDEISRILSRLFDETTDLLIPYEQLFREGLHPLLLEESLSGDDFRKLLTKYAPEPVKIDKVH
jgi:ATP-dependent Zn protease